MYLGDCFAEKSNLNPSSRLAPNRDVKPDLMGHLGPLLGLDLLAPAKQDNHQDQGGGTSDCLKRKSGCNRPKIMESLNVEVSLVFSLHSFVTSFWGIQSFVKSIV